MGECFVFRLERETAAPFAATAAPATMVVRANPVCWLLMMDIKRYTNLSRELVPNDLSLKVGAWLRQCRDAVESSGGVVDKFLGDAIFAYWKNTAEAPALVARASSSSFNSSVIRIFAILARAAAPATLPPLLPSMAEESRPCPADPGSFFPSARPGLCGDLLRLLFRFFGCRIVNRQTPLRTSRLP
jgi:hypothetical protein